MKCPLCDSILLKHGLRNHMSVAHQGDRVNKPFKCDFGGCDFSSHAKKGNIDFTQCDEKHYFSIEILKFLKKIVISKRNFI